MSSDRLGSYAEVTYPSNRRLTVDVGRLARERHRVHALLEVDVSEARARGRALRRTGQAWSFTAWVVQTIAASVAAHPQVAAFHLPARNRVLVFEDVAVTLVIERSVEGVRVPLPVVLRRADTKTVAELAVEIEAAKTQAIDDEGDLVLGGRADPRALRAYLRLPGWLRATAMRWWFLGAPKRAKAAMGTVMITTTGMAGRVRGWIVPTTIHPLCIALGSLSEEPAVHEGAVVPRLILRVTVVLDHDVVDGVPAARFVADAVRRLEAAQGV